MMYIDLPTPMFWLAFVTLDRASVSELLSTSSVASPGAETFAVLELLLLLVGRSVEQLLLLLELWAVLAALPVCCNELMVVSVEPDPWLEVLKLNS